MSYRLYRTGTLGESLEETLDDLIAGGLIGTSLAQTVLKTFDQVMHSALATRVRSKINFKAGKLLTYRLCDEVWTLILTDVEFREEGEIAMVDKVKVVAVDGRVTDLSNGNKRP